MSSCSPIPVSSAAIGPGIRMAFYILLAVPLPCLLRSCPKRLPLLRLAYALLTLSALFALIPQPPSLLAGFTVLLLSSPLLLYSTLPVLLLRAWHRRPAACSAGRQNADILDAVFLFNHSSKMHLQPLVCAAAEVYRIAPHATILAAPPPSRPPLLARLLPARLRRAPPTLTPAQRLARLNLLLADFAALATALVQDMPLKPVLVPAPPPPLSWEFGVPEPAPPITGPAGKLVDLAAFSANFVATVARCGMDPLDALSVDALVRRMTAADYRDPDALIQIDMLTEELGFVQPLDKAFGSALWATWGVVQCLFSWLWFSSFASTSSCAVRLFLGGPVSTATASLPPFLKAVSILQALVGLAAVAYGVRQAVLDLLHLDKWFTTSSPWRPDVLPPLLIPQNRPPRNAEIHAEMLGRKQLLYRWKSSVFRGMAATYSIVLAVVLTVVETTLAVNNLAMSEEPFHAPTEAVYMVVAVVCSVPILLEAVLVNKIRHADFTAAISSQKPPAGPFFDEELVCDKVRSCSTSSSSSSFSSSSSSSSSSFSPASSPRSPRSPARPALPLTPPQSPPSRTFPRSADEVREDSDQLGPLLPRRVDLRSMPGSPGSPIKNVSYPTSFKKTRGRVPLKAPPRPVRKAPSSPQFPLDNIEEVAENSDRGHFRTVSMKSINGVLVI